MVWARLADDILENEKITRAGTAGFALHAAAITWCCRNLTDGFVPRGRVARLLDLDDIGASADDVAARLVAADLWREDEERGGYWLHDFLEFNPSREEVLGKRAREKSRKNAKQSELSPSADNVPRIPQQPADNVPRIPSHPGPDPVNRINPPTPSVSAPLGASTPDVPVLVPSPPSLRTIGRRKAKTACPASDAFEIELWDWCDRWKIPRGHPELAKFMDHHSSRGTLFVDWSAAWRNWERRAPEFAAIPPPRSGARLVQPAAGPGEYDWKSKLECTA